MSRRLLAACALLIVLASLPAMPVAARRACCCRNAVSCPMHKAHDDGGCRLDRCPERDVVAVSASVRAVLVAVALPQPPEREAAFAAPRFEPQGRSFAPPLPPPRVV